MISGLHVDALVTAAVNETEGHVWKGKRGSRLVEQRIYRKRPPERGAVTMLNNQP
jgi:hypothetical protein